MDRLLRGLCGIVVDGSVCDSDDSDGGSSGARVCGGGGVGEHQGGGGKVMVRSGRCG